jgi:hypothetical protein
MFSQSTRFFALDACDRDEVLHIKMTTHSTYVNNSHRNLILSINHKLKKATVAPDIVRAAIMSAVVSAVPPILTQEMDKLRLHVLQNLRGFSSSTAVSQTI